MPTAVHLGRHLCSDRLPTSDPAPRGLRTRGLAPHLPSQGHRMDSMRGVRVPGHRCELDISKTVCNLP